LAGTSLIVTRPGFRARIREGIKSAKENEKLNLPRARGLLYTLVTVSCLSAGFILVSGIRMIYVVRATNYLEQLQRVVSPYIGMDQRLMIQSRVAQIESKNDYEAVVAEMIKIAETNKLRIPTFDIN
jgi:hypothetical protein